jgi:hypothetical protein
VANCFQMMGEKLSKNSVKKLSHCTIYADEGEFRYENAENGRKMGR